MRIAGIIPARYGSTRFPGKPLVSIAGKPLIAHVVQRCLLCHTLSEVIVATDDERIAAITRNLCRTEMTRADHPTGSDRIAEVAARLDCDAIINVQGDEPLMDPQVVDAVAGALAQSPMSTAATPLSDPLDIANPNVVKVVVSLAGRALYFSRHGIPFLREAGAQFPFLKHLGIYGYRRELLLQLVQWPVSLLENAEKLEQLRALENGVEIAVKIVEHQGVGVDTPEDVLKAEKLLALAGA